MTRNTMKPCSDDIFAEANQSWAKNAPTFASSATRFSASSSRFRLTGTRTAPVQHHPTMNTTLKTETVALRQIVPLFHLLCVFTFVPFGGMVVCSAQTPPSVQSATEGIATGPNMSPQELQSLVGPVALYPDSLLVQTLAASTYPLEIVQLKQWLDKNKTLKGQALVEAVAQQNWDPSVQALSAFPAVVDKLFNNIQWTTDLGNAFLAQQSDLMDAVQRLRATAQENGVLNSNDKQKVSAESLDDGKQAITIEPAQREVVYVPSYNTQYVYRDSDYSNYSGYSDSGYSGSGSSGYSEDGYSWAAYAVGAAYGAAYGYYNWRDRYAEVNYNNYYNRNWNNKVNNWNKNTWKNNGNNWNNNSGNGNRSEANRFSQRPTEGSGRWQHDPGHRGNTPYGNRNLAERFGQPNNRLGGGEGGRASQLASARNQLARNNFSHGPGESARGGMRSPGAGAPNRIGNRAPTNFPRSAQGGAFSPPRGDAARAFSARGAQSMTPPGGFRGGPPGGLRGGGPPMGGGFHGGPPMGGGGPPMGGPPMGGPPMGGPPMGGAPPPPPPPGP